MNISLQRPAREWSFLILANLLIVSGCATPPCAAEAAETRVMIVFQSARDGAAPALLDLLSQRSGAGIRYVAAVSDTTHAYALHCASTDPDCAVALEHLRTTPDIVSISPDGRRLPHPTQTP